MGWNKEGGEDGEQNKTRWRSKGAENRRDKITMVMRKEERGESG